ncbi:MAG: nucleotidyltransferase family protein [Candidatus Latescibacter sp.]|nr:nucleotidyltransferase family protein [Candidatus Latescibacter sp.]
MIQNIPFEPILHYLYRILDIDPEEFSRRPQEIWQALYQLSSKEMIVLYFIAWSYDNWREYFPDERQKEFKDYLFRNQSRNIVLQSEIVYLAKIFKDAEIPIMFLKGSAGLIRGLYPLSLRFISDIDALVPMNKIEPSRELLASRGFLQTHKQTFFDKIHHHIEPYNNPAYPGEIEIHINPYDLSCLKKPEMPEIWDDAERIPYKREEVIVPSITDHAWILMRTDMLSKAFLPRIRDVIEMYQIQQKGYRVDFQLINKRADKDNISNAVKGMSYACSKYMGLKPLPCDDSLLVKWEEWTLKYKRKFINKSKDDLFIIYCAGIRYLPSGIVYRIHFISWLLRYNLHTCLLIVLQKLLRITGFLKPAKRLRKYLKENF